MQFRFPLSAMHALWLVYYSHGCLRLRRRTRQQESQQIALPRCRLPSSPWWTELLQVEGISAKYEACASKSTVRLMALVQVAPGLMEAGPLTPWGREALFQKAYYLWPRDAFSLVVASVVLAPNNCAAPLYRKSKEGVVGIAEKLLSIHDDDGVRH